MHVLRHVHRALKAKGLLLDIHPLGTDIAVRAGLRGLGFVDARAFARVVDAMDERVAQVIAEGLFREVTTARRHVVERFDDAADLLEHAEGWENLRLPAAVRRRLREATERPVELTDAVEYNLLRKRAAGRPRKSSRPRAPS